MVFTLILGNAGQERMLRFSGLEFFFSLSVLFLAVDFVREPKRPSHLPSSYFGLLAIPWLIPLLRAPGLGAAMEALQFVVSILLPAAALCHFCRDREFRIKAVVAFLAGVGLSLIIATAQALCGTDPRLVRGFSPTNQVLTVLLTVAIPFAISLLHGRWSRGMTLFSATGILTLGSFLVADPVMVAGMWMSAVLAVFFSGGRQQLLVFAVTSLIIGVAVQALVNGREMKAAGTSREYADVSVAYLHASSLANFVPGQSPEVEIGGRNVRLGFYGVPVAAEAKPPPDLEFDSTILKQRYAEWVAAIRLFMNFPFLGAGPGNYQATIGEYYTPLPKLNTTVPDRQNGWLVLLASLGFAGLVLVGGPTVAAALAFRLKDEPLAGALAASATGLLFAGLWMPPLQTGLTGALCLGLGLTVSLLKFPRMKNTFQLGVAAVFVPFLITGTRILLSESAPDTKLVYRWIEAESAHSVEEPAELMTDPTASGGGGLRIPEGAGTGWREEAGGEAKYVVDLPGDAKWTLWGRTRWKDGCGNAFYVSVNGGRKLILGNDAEFGRWHWVRIPGIPMQPGSNSITISNREDGVELDKLLITNDTDFQPSHTWELAFSDSFKTEDLHGWIRLDENAPWVHRDIDGRGCLAASQRRLPIVDSALVLDGAIDTDFRITSLVHFEEVSSDAALLFRYEDPRHYYAAVISPSRAGIARVQNGVTETLTEKARETPVGRWTELELQVRNGVLILSIDGSEELAVVDRRVSRGSLGFSTSVGGVSIAEFKVRPVEGIFRRFELAEVEGQKEFNVGTPDWSNYTLTLEVDDFSRIKPVRLCIHEDTWIELSFDSVALNISERGVPSDGSEWTLELDDPLAPGDRVTFRVYDREVRTFLNDNSIGNTFFSADRVLKGSISFSADGFLSAEVRGLRRFYDGFGGCDGNNSASWTPVHGEWRVVDESIEGFQDTFAATGEENLALAGSPHWQAYDFGFAVRNSAAEAIEGRFNIVGNDTYEGIRWDGEGLAVFRHKAGSETVIARLPRPPMEDRWYEFEIRNAKESRQLLLDGEVVLRFDKTGPQRGRIGLWSRGGPGAFFDNIRVDIP